MVGFEADMVPEAGAVVAVAARVIESCSGRTVVFEVGAAIWARHGGSFPLFWRFSTFRSSYSTK